MGPQFTTRQGHATQNPGDRLRIGAAAPEEPSPLDRFGSPTLAGGSARLPGYLRGADKLSSDGSLSEQEASELAPSEESEAGSGSDPDGFWDSLGTHQYAHGCHRNTPTLYQKGFKTDWNQAAAHLR